MTQPSLPILKPSASLLPKPLARAAASTYLRLRTYPRLLFFGIVCIICVPFLKLVHQARTKKTAGSHLLPSLPDKDLKPLAGRGYAPTVVKDCAQRTPGESGRTFETKVRGVHVSFVSWTSNATFSKDLVHLRTHEAVRIMSQFRRSATLLDVGANVGKVSFPVLAMPQIHTVIAVEPVGVNVNQLCMTANLNGWLANPGFVLLQAAFSDKQGKMDIYVPEGREDNAALSSEAATANVHEPKRGEVVRVLLGDDVLHEGRYKPDVIKIDTQGHELHVLNGLKRFLASAPPGEVLVMAESDPKLMHLSNVDPKQVYDLMVAQLGYSAYCRPLIEVQDGMHISVQGEELSRETYPPGGCRDLFYFKPVR